MLLWTVPVGVFRCNCAIVACERSRQAIVIDPGDHPARILEIIQGHDLGVTTVVHTHGHIDHIMGTFAVVEATGASVRLHAADRRLFQRVGAVAESLRIPPPRIPSLAEPLADGETIRFGREAVRVIHTPGHTPGSCCFVSEQSDGRQVLFSGDTLFRGSIGMPTPASPAVRAALHASIRDRILTLADRTRVIPGHGPETEIGIERHHNRSLAGG